MGAQFVWHCLPLDMYMTNQEIKYFSKCFNYAETDRLVPVSTGHKAAKGAEAAAENQWVL